MALADAAGEGRLKALVTLRDLLARQIDECDSKRDLAALSLRFTDVLEQIEAVERLLPAEKGTALDEFTRRRAEREAAGAPRPARRSQRG